MNYILLVIIMGLIGACIGWITNVLAIKLLFRPYIEYKVPFLKWRIQGLIPKRRQEIAVALGKVVSTELITGNDVMKSLGREDIKAHLREKTEKYVSEQVLLRMPNIIMTGVVTTMADFAGRIVGQEIINVLDNPDKIFELDELDDIKKEIERIVKEKIMAFDMARIEELVYLLAKSELNHIEMIGGVLGFLIGVVQGVISISWKGIF
ncbi:MAG: DUF445 family protein [Clostridia bacterium]|nr:DUF445 family protein [Clostridia bacterium]MDD4048164.1 DUF445 family protein [Clostridia bacterium]